MFSLCQGILSSGSTRGHTWYVASVTKSDRVFPHALFRGIRPRNLYGRLLPFGTLMFRHVCYQNLKKATKKLRKLRKTQRKMYTYTWSKRANRTQ
ncbi:hypothetical protein PUN28_004270 [Cardiocondyla obscurior]|uniref:Uncharacterized protein n=1 Tax=Cardiocondyla obscurior TaxID=286306 RepID=A0AAW2GBM9_9HYME